MALRTSVGSGLWSIVGTWDTGVPADTDTFLIASGHTVTFDVDQSGFAAGMGASVITGALVASTTAGTYHMKMNGNITGAGTLTAGTSVSLYPANCKFTIQFAAGAYFIYMPTLNAVNLWCQNPATKYVKLTGDEAINSTALGVDTDVSASWAATDQVLICTKYGRETTAELRTIDSITSDTINITAGLTVAKTTGDYILLLTRNIVIYGAGTAASYFFNGLVGGYIGAYTNTMNRGSISCNGTTWLPQSVIYNCSYGHSTTAGVIYQNGIICGCTYIFYITYSVSIGTTGMILACYGAQYTTTIVLKGLVACCNVFGVQCSEITIDGGILRDCQTPFSYCSNIICSNGTFTNNSVNSINILFGKNTFYNTLFADTTEFLNYNHALIREIDYTESFTHDNEAGAFRCWTKGGIVDKQSLIYPTDKTYSYSHACGSASYPCYRQIATTIEPNSTLKIDWRMRKSVSMAILPKCEIIDVFNDPLVVSTDVALATATMTNSVDTWESGVLTYKNTGTTIMKVLVRFTAQNASGNFYEFGEAKQYSTGIVL